MNKKYILVSIVLALMTLTFTSCSDFLNMTPRDKKVVKTIEDHRDILASYMYLLKTPTGAQVNVMGVGSYTYPYFDMTRVLSIYTGESEMTTLWRTYYDENKGGFNEAGIKRITWSVAEPYVWNQYFSFLGPINMLIKDIATAEGADENLRNYVQGEALVWRAFSYFKMLQYYSPYKEDKYGLPMYLDPSEDIGTAMPARQTQTAVFEQILNDCNRVLTMLKQTPSNDWNFAYNEEFVHAMMTSVYTWKAMSGAAASDDWKMAKEHAEKAIGGRKLATSQDQLKRMFDCSQDALNVPYQDTEFYLRIVSNRRTWSVVDSRTSYVKDQYGFFSGLATGVADKQFVDMYADGDKRKDFYFKTEDGKTFLNDKYNLFTYYPWDSDEIGCLMLFRLAEMYLIKAEAACRMGDAATGAETLRAFKASRYKTAQTVPAGADELLKEILLERKREFYLENDMLWLDMKRTGERVERTVNGQKYVLEPNDFRYSFPIPQAELEKNKNVQQNPGWENVYQD